VAEKEIQNAAVLAILPAREDRLSLSAAFGDSGWILVFTGNLAEALAVLRSIVVEVVLCDLCFPEGHTWRDLLHEMLKMEDPPPLIVADRLADDWLWAEVLGLGAENLLAKPFHSGEVLRAVTTACWRHEKQRGPVRKRIQPETGSRETKEAARAIAAAR
jgi:DNA-binding NtrC family response regulator